MIKIHCRAKKYIIENRKNKGVRDFFRRRALPRSFRAQIVCNAGILRASPQAVIPHAFSVLCPHAAGKAGKAALPFAAGKAGRAVIPHAFSVLCPNAAGKTGRAVLPFAAGKAGRTALLFSGWVRKRGCCKNVFLYLLRLS